VAPIIENSRRSLKKQWTKPLPRHEKPFDKCFFQVRRPSIEYGKWLSAPLLLSSVLLLLCLLGLSSCRQTKVLLRSCSRYLRRSRGFSQGSYPTRPSAVPRGKRELVAHHGCGCLTVFHSRLRLGLGNPRPGGAVRGG